MQIKKECIGGGRGGEEEWKEWLAYLSVWWVFLPIFGELCKLVYFLSVLKASCFKFKKIFYP